MKKILAYKTKPDNDVLLVTKEPNNSQIYLILDELHSKGCAFTLTNKDNIYHLILEGETPIDWSKYGIEFSELCID